MGILISRRPNVVTPRRWIQSPRQVRALRASGTRIRPGDRADVRMLNSVRQPWQTRAWEYHDAVGELRYAIAYQGNAARRMMLFPAVYVPGQLLPVPVEDSDLKRHSSVCQDALDRVGDVGGRGSLLGRQMENFGVAGECYLVSRIDDGDGLKREVWEIRSISEVLTTGSDRVLLCDMPNTHSWNASSSDTYELQPDDFISRLWRPHPRYRQLANSPLRAAETILEELTILSKDARAAGVSRLVSNGILMLPDSLSVSRAAVNDEDSGEGEDDPFLAEMIEAAVEAIQDPGSAPAAMPLLVRGPAEALEKVRHLVLERPESNNAGKRTEALRRLATSLDLPSEVIVGLADLNHWSAWAVDESTFRSHIEPDVQVQVDSWTAGYYRRYLLETGVPPDDVARMVVWYDPTELLSKPDKSQDAKEAFDKDALSWRALRHHLGFTEDEAPDEQELVMHLLLKGKALDPALAVQLVRLLDPRLEKPEPTVVVPVIGPGAVPPGEPEGGPEGDRPPDEVGPPPATGPPQPAAPTPAQQAAAALRDRLGAIRQHRRENGHPAELRARIDEIRGRRLADQAELDSLVAATRSLVPGWAVGVSRRLAERDAQIRESLRQACEATVRRTLERAGARVISRARQKDQLAAAACRGVPTWTVPGRLGPAVVAALGLAEDLLVTADLSDLRLLYNQYVESGMDQALTDAAKLAPLDLPQVLGKLGDKMRRDRNDGWALLCKVLDRNTRRALVSDPSLHASAEVDTAQLVPTSGVRAALAIAGGFNTPLSRGINETTLLPNDPNEHFGQLGTGTTIRGVLESHGAKLERYQWAYGFSIRPFPPHQQLDGHEFDSWSDGRLATDPPVRGQTPAKLSGGIGPDHPKWAPTMSTGEADRYVSDSVYHQTFYHGTPSGPAVEQIRKSGFDEGRIGANTQNVGWMGRGLYFTESPGYAAGYTQYADEAGVIAVKVRMKSPWVSGLRRQRDDDMWAYAESIGGRGMTRDALAERLRKEAERRGHDGIVIIGSTNQVSEMVVFRKDQAVIVDVLNPMEARRRDPG